MKIVYYFIKQKSIIHSNSIKIIEIHKKKKYYSLTTLFGGFTLLEKAFHSYLKNKLKKRPEHFHLINEEY